MNHDEYIRNNNSKIAVLMIHGILGTPRHFDCLLSAFPSDWDIYNILLDGHGGSVDDFSKSSMEKWKEQTEKTVCNLCKKYDKIVILAHSMGTLLSLSALLKKPCKIKCLFLLNVPLKMHLAPSAVMNSVKVIFDRIDPNNSKEMSVKNACSITTTKKLWKYIYWIPRYLELFKLASIISSNIDKIRVPCHIFQSKNDELVSLSSLRELKKNKDFKINMLKFSGHFSYDKKDICFIRNYIKRISNTL